MSKPNLTNDVLNAVRKGKTSPSEIAEFILGNPNSVRSALRRLTQRGEIVRVSRGLYHSQTVGFTEEGLPISEGMAATPSFSIALRHYVSTLHYCNGKQRQWYALTWTDEEIDLEEQLIAEINEQAESSCSSARADNGYSQESFDDLGSPKYPEIEVGML